MQCNELEQILEQQADGPLPDVATAHINGCDTCRALTADLEAIHTVAIELGTDQPAPPEHVWIALRNQLEAEGIIHDPALAPQSVKRGWWFAFQRPELASAFLFLVLIAAGLASYMGNSAQMAGHLTVPRQIEFRQAI